MIKPNKLATSIAIAIGVSAISSGAAVAGAGLWPHVVNSPSVTTVVSVINSDTSPTSPDTLHYILWYKNIDPDTSATPPNLRACEEVNVFLPTSPNDIQSIDLGNVFTDPTEDPRLGVLFNDPSVNNDWAGSGRTFALAQAANTTPLRGYLVVDNSDTAGENVSGDALVLEYATGAAWGYYAKTDSGDDFEDEGISHLDSAQISAKPFAQIDTSFMVTPVGPDMSLVGNYTADINLNVGGISVMYDRDENPVSGANPATVRCVGRVEATDLVTGGAQSFLPDGGWSNLIVTNPLGGAVVYQLEYGIDNFNGQPLPAGAQGNYYNNAFELAE
ncbi:hypothetical protein U5801_17110 [Lamprobacter modestohalophilus]|uniref:hypothetical protein n=1 Tax=Lamprobacter modestohalophilus TaxID=1064514 RepID=UPI002ADECA52|nr:hypothetical protein [Lamprobacter modestohalophilus]MEA1051512.1 hypothetical protein [Lamprobacter modestohalophilus]